MKLIVMFQLGLLLITSPLFPLAKVASSDCITGEKFKTVSDFVLDHNTIGAPFSGAQVEDGDIVFVKTDYLETFFTSIHPHIKAYYVLITHDGAYPVPRNFGHFLDDPHLIAWLGKNITKGHPKLIPIPVGVQDKALMQSMGTKNANLMSQGTSVLDKVLLETSKVKKYLLSMAINLDTHPERAEVYRLFHDKSFCTTFDYPLQYEEYIPMLAQSHFVLSPRGFGIDSFRTWEALSLGAYPIVKHSHLDPMFEDLPVVLVDDWNEITEQFLTRTLSEFAQREFDNTKCTMTYWIDLINSYKAKALEKRSQEPQWVPVDFDESLGKDATDRRAFRFEDFTSSSPSYAQTWDMAVTPNTTSDVYGRLKKLYEKNLPFAHQGSFYTIPLIIHQIWIQGDMPGEYAHWQKTWQERMPGWNYLLWTDKDIRQLPLMNRRLYEEETNPGAKSSLARIEILNLFGGFYADLDSECVRPELLEKLLKSYSFVAGIGPLDCGVFCVKNAAIGSVAGHPIVQDYLTSISEWVSTEDGDYYKQHQVSMFGPVPFTQSVLRAIDQPGYTDIILPPTFLYPLAFTDSAQKVAALKKMPECVCMDHWQAAWVNYNPDDVAAQVFPYEQSPSLTGNHLPRAMRQPVISPTPWLASREAMLQQLPKNAVVAEIGVQSGHFSAAILRYARPKKLYLIDCWQEQADEDYPSMHANVEQKHQDELYEKVKKRFAGDSRVEIIKSFTPEVAAFFEDGFFDWVYIDANHIYRSVRDDLVAWSQKVKKGGFICGHDYTNKAQVSIGVIPAVNEFLKYNEVELAYLTTDHWASFGLQKKE